MNKKGEKSNKNLIWLLVIGVLAYMIFSGKITWPSNGGTGTGTGTGGVIGGAEGCQIEDISFTPKMTRLGKAGTSLSTGAYNYFILTDKLGTVGAGTAKTVPTNYNMQVMFGENSTAYYTYVKTISTGCQDPKYESIQLAYADTSLNSFYAKNADGSVNSATNAQAVGAGDVIETTFTIKAGSDEYFGNPNSNCKNVAVVQFDKTDFSKVEGDDPASLQVNYLNSTYDGQAAFYIPKVANGGEASFNVQFTAHNSNNPSGNGNSPIIELYDCDIDKNEDTLALIEGVEDEDLNIISLAKQNMTFVVS